MQQYLKSLPRPLAVGVLRVQNDEDTSEITLVSVIHDGRRVETKSKDGAVIVYDLETGVEFRTKMGPSYVQTWPNLIWLYSDRLMARWVWSSDTPQAAACHGATKISSKHTVTEGDIDDTETNDDGAAVVKQVDGLAKESGIQAGDVLSTIGETKVADINDSGDLQQIWRAYHTSTGCVPAAGPER